MFNSGSLVMWWYFDWYILEGCYSAFFFIRCYENGGIVMWGLYTVCEKGSFFKQYWVSVGILKNDMKGDVCDAGSWEDFWL